MAYVKIDLAQPETLNELTVQVLEDLLELGQAVESLHLELAGTNQDIEIVQTRIAREEETEWTRLRSEAEVSGPPKDPLTKRSNKDFNEALVTERLQKNVLWLELQEQRSELQQLQIRQVQEISGTTARLEGLQVAGHLLGRTLCSARHH